MRPDGIMDLPLSISRQRKEVRQEYSEHISHFFFAGFVVSELPPGVLFVIGSRHTVLLLVLLTANIYTHRAWWRKSRDPDFWGGATATTSTL